MNQHALVLVNYPFTDSFDTKIRPAVILSNDSFNAMHKFVIMCPLSSKESLPMYEIQVKDGEYEGTLHAKSFVRTDNVMSIGKNFIVKEIGKVNADLLRRIIEKINQNF